MSFEKLFMSKKWFLVTNKFTNEQYKYFDFDIEHIKKNIWEDLTPQCPYFELDKYFEITEM